MRRRAAGKFQIASENENQESQFVLYYNIVTDRGCYVERGGFATLSKFDGAETALSWTLPTLAKHQTLHSVNQSLSLPPCRKPLYRT